MNSSLRKEGLKFDEAHSSLLKRANQTCDQILTELGQPEIPVHRHWRLNERHYGQDSYKLNKITLFFDFLIFWDFVSKQRRFNWPKQKRGGGKIWCGTSATLAPELRHFAT